MGAHRSSRQTTAVVAIPSEAPARTRAYLCRHSALHRPDCLGAERHRVSLRSQAQVWPQQEFPATVAAHTDSIGVRCDSDRAGQRTGLPPVSSPPRYSPSQQSRLGCREQQRFSRPAVPQRFFAVSTEVDRRSRLPQSYLRQRRSGRSANVSPPGRICLVLIAPGARQQLTSLYLNIACGPELGCRPLRLHRKYP